MFKYRIRFKKTGRAVYISHLDLMHTFQRTFSRSGYRLEYSAGFNPHPALSIALPLGVGCSSQCEILDFDGDKPEIEVLNKNLPEGIEVVELYVPQRKAAEIKYLEVEGDFFYDSTNVPNIAEILSAGELVVSKKGKSGFTDTDIKPMIKKIEVVGTHINAIICAQNPTLNPEYIGKALGDYAPDFAKYNRLETLDEDYKIFR